MASATPAAYGWMLFTAMLATACLGSMAATPLSPQYWQKLVDGSDHSGITEVNVTSIIPPDDMEVLAIYFGGGTQNFTCDTNNTVIASGAVAKLWTVPGGALVGNHFFDASGPVWETTTGRAAARKLAQVPSSRPASGADLLLQVTAGSGSLAAATYINRALTSGGRAPATCQTPGATTTVPYTAFYIFYRNTTWEDSGCEEYSQPLSPTYWYDLIDGEDHNGVTEVNVTVVLPPKQAAVTAKYFGVGTQNFSCDSNSTLQATGAVAKLYSVPAGVLVGSHFFTAAGPTWETSTGHAAAVKLSQVASAHPASGADLLLQVIDSSGSLAHSSYINRALTSGGRAPPVCRTPNSTIVVPYTAYYIFYSNTTYTGRRGLFWWRHG